MKDFLNADFKDIIAEIKQSRKGAAMIICFICLCCAAIDFILRKHGINEDWFTHSYILIFFTSLATILIKVYNEICDKKDAERELKEKQELRKTKLRTFLKMILPLFHQIDVLEEAILKQFIEEHSRVITVKAKLIDPLHVIASINEKLSCVQLKINIITDYPSLVVQIDEEFYEILELYFSEGLQK